MVPSVFSTKYQYVTAYKGLIFHTKTQTPLRLPAGTETVQAKNIWIPGGTWSMEQGRWCGGRGMSLCRTSAQLSVFFTDPFRMPPV